MDKSRDNSLSSNQISSQAHENTRQMITVPIELLSSCNQEEDEIDLRELIAVILRRKWLIGAVTGLVLGLALVYVFILAKPAFEARVTIEIGHYLNTGSGRGNNIEYFGKALAIKQYIDVKYDTAGKYRPKEAMAFISKVSIPRKIEGFFTVTAFGADNRQAIAILKKPVDDIMSKHQAFYKSLLEKKQDQIKRLVASIDFNRNITLPRLQTELKVLKTVDLEKIDKKIWLTREIDLKKIDDRIRLVKEVDIKKIDDKIRFYKSVRIPSLGQKITKCYKEITDKENAIGKLSPRLESLVNQDAAMATMTAIQVANLQNSLVTLKIRVIDLQSKIREIEEQAIPDLQKQKIRILEQIIPDLQKQKIRILEQTLPALKAEKQRLLDELIPQKTAAIKKLLEITIPDLQNKIKQIKREMQPPYLVKTSTVGRILTHDYPVKPRKKLIVALAVIMGLMLGIFAAFFLEFITSNKEQ